MKLMDWFSKPGRLQSRSSCGLARETAGGLDTGFMLLVKAKVLALGQEMAAAFHCRPSRLETPPPPKHKHTDRKAFRTFLPPFTVNPGEGVLCQLMANNSKPDSLSVNGDNTEIKCYSRPELFWPLFLF